MPTNNSINSNIPIEVTKGGTGIATVAQGDILYGSAANIITALAKNTNATRYLANTGTSNNPAWAQVNLANGVTNALPIANGGTNATSFTQSAGIVAFNGTSLVNYTGPQIDSTGRLTNTTQPAFLAVTTTDQNNVTGDGTTISPVLFGTEVFDQGNNYASNTFTAPVTGRYVLGTAVIRKGAGTSTATNLNIKTTAKTYLAYGGMLSNGSGNYTMTLQVTANMTAGDTAIIEFGVSGGTKNVGYFADSYFYGCLIN